MSSEFFQIFGKIIIDSVKILEDNAT